MSIFLFILLLIFLFIYICIYVSFSFSFSFFFITSGPTGIESQLDKKLLENGVNAGDDIMVMVVNEGEIDLYLNFICSCKQNKINMKKILVFAASRYKITFIFSFLFHYLINFDIILFPIIFYFFLLFLLNFCTAFLTN